MCLQVGFAQWWDITDCLSLTCVVLSDGSLLVEKPALPDERCWKSETSDHLGIKSEICWVMTNCWLILLATLRLRSFLLKGYIFFINRCSEINLKSWKTVFVFSLYIIYENISQQACLVSRPANEHVQAVKIAQKFDLICVAILVYCIMYCVIMKNILEQFDVRTKMSLWNECSLVSLVFCCTFLWNYFSFWQEYHGTVSSVNCSDLEIYLNNLF